MSKIGYIGFMPNRIGDNTLRKEIGRRLKVVRQSLDMPQKALAYKLDTTQSNIANIERGAIFPNNFMLFTLASEYRVNITWLINGTGSMFVIDMKVYESDKPPDARYTELLNEMMRNPDMEEMIFAKFKELKLIMDIKKDKDKDVT
jgi:transcriptional regulator with XRE-family HTH domain